jgi:dihydrodipicolinate synthase/N-acetylneuraminate lyase
MDATEDVRRLLVQGMVIPAHPLALTAERHLDERRQVALTRYYCEAGAGGIAVGVHTTQFAIRNPRVGLYLPVLRLAADAIDECERRTAHRIVRIAGACGPTAQAVGEAGLARELGYDAALLSLAGWEEAPPAHLITHCREVAAVVPLFGFYLQPAVGGRPLDEAFWREFLEIPGVVGIKVAPFDRYRTLDVVRALAASGRQAEVALYTGNDDNIVADLLTDFPGFSADSPAVTFAGGLLGQWAVWTKRAVELLERVRMVRAGSPEATLTPLRLGAELTDANAAIFDARHNFAGCIPGIHEALCRQGLLAGRWCLDPLEMLSPGQLEAIDRVHARYPHLRDDEFVAERIDGWLR